MARGYDLTVMGNVSKFDVEAVIAALSERIEDFLGPGHRLTPS